MSRRAAYQYGGYLDKGPQGSLAMGIGNGQSAGKTSFIRPTYEVATSGEWLTIDGVRMQFQLMPGTEAPAEMNTWIPERRALWVAENCTGTLHNLYTLRGAQVRDGNAWAKYITEAVALYGSEVEVTFQSHNWPHWGNAAVNDYMVNTAAIYKFINDQAPSMLNNGKVSAEIAHEITLPAALEQSAPATRCALCAAPNMASLTPANHAHGLRQVKAKPATAEAEGNTAYWHCPDCGRCFVDEAGTAEVSKKAPLCPNLPT